MLVAYIRSLKEIQSQKQERHKDYPGKLSRGRKPNKLPQYILANQEQFFSLKRELTKEKILLYSFTRKSSAPLNQEIPRDRPKPFLTSHPVVAASPPRLAHFSSCYKSHK
jgi:hypothetical protein